MNWNVGMFDNLLYNQIRRQERITYEGSYHHVMNRGYNGNHIFEGNNTKSQFLDYLEAAAKKIRIRLFAYCIMNNHYHLILENSNGRMSDFVKLLNGQYGMFYRKKFGGKGYVFQTRYKTIPKTIPENHPRMVQRCKFFRHTLYKMVSRKNAHLHAPGLGFTVPPGIHIVV